MKPSPWHVILFFAECLAATLSYGATPWAGDYGLPEGTPHDNGAFIYCVDGMTRNPRWVAHVIVDGPIGGGIRGDFYSDQLIPKAWRATGEDYPGYDQGHAFPWGDAQSDLARKKSMCRSNMCPQLADFNRNFWGKRIETAVRAMSDKGLTLYVVSGPAYAQPVDGTITIKTIGKHNLWVPAAFFKAVLVVRDTTPIGMRSWLVPHEAIPHDADEEIYRLPVCDLQERVALDLWSGLPDDVEVRLEGAK